MAVLEGGLAGALGVDGGWLPVPTRPQRYCDLVSLVICLSGLVCMSVFLPVFLTHAAQLGGKAYEHKKYEKHTSSWTSKIKL